MDNSKGRTSVYSGGPKSGPKYYYYYYYYYYLYMGKAAEVTTIG
jgi:hypothetical protein